MDRAVLIALLGIPVLIVIHIAVFWQPVPWSAAMAWTTAREGTQLQGYWQSSDETLPARFVVEHQTQRGS